MKTNLNTKWWLDVVFFAGFLAAFFLELTGLAVHQWLGVAAGAFALYHLVTRWDWVKAVTARLFGKTSSQARLYYLLDALLLAGFFTIVGTGLVISSWLNLSLANYGLWRAVHIIASIETLLALVVKLGLHARWITSTARKIFAAPVKTPARAAIPGSPRVVVVPDLGRRDFLKLMGVVGATSVVAMGSSFKSLGDSTAAGAVAQLSTGTTDSGVSSTTTTATTTTSTTSAAVQAVTTASQTTNSACVIRCGKGCSYPGRCGRYTDSNNNQRCDLGECI